MFTGFQLPLFLSLFFFDVTGRQALLQHFADSVIVAYYRKVAAYITSLPGVRTLPSEDQHALLKCEHFYYFYVFLNIQYIKCSYSTLLQLFASLLHFILGNN